MNPVDAALTAATGGAWGWLRLGWKALPWVLLAAALAGLALTREKLEGIRSQGKLNAAAAQVASAQHDAAEARRTTDAVKSFADEMLGRAPVVLQATNTVREYANTPAGRAICAPPDVVRRTDALDASLFPLEADPAGGDAKVPADAPPPATGWLGKLLGR